MLDTRPSRVASIIAAVALLAWAAACGDWNTEPPTEVPNRAPLSIGTIPSRTMHVGDSATLDVADYFTDPDGDMVSYTVGSSDPATATATAVGSSITLAAINQGSATVTVTATDPGDLSATQTFEVTVPNRAPLSVDSIQRLELVEGDTTSLDIVGYFADPDGDTLAYTVESSSAETATATADGNRITVAAVTHGSATITITASDPGGLSASLNFDVTVEGPPLSVAFADETATIPEGGTAALSVKLSRPSETPLLVTYSLGADEDPTTYDADEADYGNNPRGTIEFEPGTTTATLSVVINDDPDIEPVREILRATLEPPASEAEYLLGSPASATVTIEEGVCDRTPGVRDKIMDQVGVVDCSRTNGQQLARIWYLPLCFDPEDAVDSHCSLQHPLTELQPGDFLGLTGLRTLDLTSNNLSGLPPDLFHGVDSLQRLLMISNRLREFPSGALAHLTQLEQLYLSDNQLTNLPSGALSPHPFLKFLLLSGNQLDSLPGDVFAGLTRLEFLGLQRNRIAELPTGIFSGLSALQDLLLFGNPGAPFTFTLELERVDNQDLLAPGPGRVAASIAQGAPFDMRVPILTRGGTPSTDTLVFETGSTKSAEVVVTRTADGHAGTLLSATAPESPHRDINLSAGKPIVLFPPTAPITALATDSTAAPEGGNVVIEVILSPPPASPITLTYGVSVDDDPATEDADTADFIGLGDSLHVAAGTGSIPIDIAVNDDDEIESPREVLIVSLNEPDSATGYLLGHSTRAIVTIEEGVCDRTPQVRDEIVRQAGASRCTEVQSVDLASLIRLTIVPGGSPVSSADDASDDWSTLDPFGSLDSVQDQSATAGFLNPEPLTLKSGDFAGLSGLYYLNIRDFELTLPDEFLADIPGLGSLRLKNSHLRDFPWQQLLHTPELRLLNLEATGLSHLPSRALATLSDLWSLNLAGNQFSELPEEAFAGLSKLESLFLGTNPLTSLPAGVFSELSALRWLGLHRIQARELPSDVFLPLRSLARLDFDYTPIRAIPSLAGLSELRVLDLTYNPHVTELPRGIEDLRKLDWLQLSGNSGLSLRPEMFAGFDELRHLFLGSMEIEELPPRLLSGLPSLQFLGLHGNRIRSLPGGAFSGLTELSSLHLHGNRLTELPAGIFQGLSSLGALRLDDNPGAPFALGLEAFRADTSDLLAPGPATVEIRLAEGAPFSVDVPLTVHRGNISTNTVELDGGSLASARVIVDPLIGSGEGTQVVAGPAPAVRPPFFGIELKVGEPLVLFDTVANRAPVAERAIPPRRLRVGGTAGMVIASSHFRDPDGDVLAYRVVSSDPDVMSTTVTGDLIGLEPHTVGSATVTVTASDSGGLGAQLSFQVSVVGGRPGLFDIDLILVDEVSSEVQVAFDDAIAFWSAILAETELPDVTLDDDMEVGCWDVTTDERLGTVDDLVIVASVRPIDGVGRVLAGAGPCGLRDESLLPFMGAMIFDAEDLEWLAETGDMLEVVAHEIGHVLGIGTIWERLDLLRNPSLPSNQGADTHFPGTLAIAAFDDAGGSDYTDGEKVPVENLAGRGSGDVHWRESVLDHELMTPYQDVGIFDPLSAITIQSLADLGYTVEVSLAEVFALPGTTAADVAQPRRKLAYGDDILTGPIAVVDRNGRIVRVIPEPGG